MKRLQIAMLRRDPVGLATWVVLFAWMAITAGAFWHFELGNWRGFGQSQAPHTLDTTLAEEWFRTAGLPPRTAAPSVVTFVHLYNPKCRCNRFTEPHLARLQEAFSGRGVRFVSAASTPGGPAPMGLEAIHADTRLLHAAGVDSAPSALIFDGGGRLLYYGPYSNSAWCGSAGALVDPVLTRALSGSVRFSAVPALRGCFCEW